MGNLTCKYCSSNNVICNGNKNNKQRYLCKDCNKSFSFTDNRIKRDIKERELAFVLYNHNISLRAIQSIIEEFFKTKISISLIEKWAVSFDNLLQSSGIKRVKNKRELERIKLEDRFINGKRTIHLLKLLAIQRDKYKNNRNL